MDPAVSAAPVTMRNPREDEVVELVTQALVVLEVRRSNGVSTSEADSLEALGWKLLRRAREMVRFGLAELEVRDLVAARQGDQDAGQRFVAQNYDELTGSLSARLHGVEPAAGGRLADLEVTLRNIVTGRAA